MASATAFTAADFDQPSAPASGAGPFTADDFGDVPAKRAAAPKSALGSVWNWLNAPNAGMEKFSEGHPTLAVPMRMANAAGAAIENAPRATYEMLRHPEASTQQQVQQADEGLGISKFEGEHPVLRALDPTGGALTAAAAVGHGVAHNLREGYEGGVLPEALGEGAGTYLAGKAAGKLTDMVGKPVVEAVRRVPNIVRAAPMTPEDVGTLSSGRRIAAAGQQIGSIAAKLAQTRKSLSPIYENIHDIDLADSPAGVELPEGAQEAAKELAPKAESKPRLSVGEAQDLDRPNRSGSGAPTRGQAASALAQKLLAQGLKEDEVASVMKNQFALSSKQAEAVMHDASTPAEGGGYTISKARALRSSLRDAADRAAAKEDFQNEAKFTRAAKQVTSAMRERVKQLDPQGRLLNDFDRADEAYAQTREDQRVLKPLLDAVEGDRTPSPEKLTAAWSRLSAAQRSALERLSKNSGLDLPELERGAKTLGKVQRGTQPAHVGFMDRYVKGEIPLKMTALGVGAGGAALGYFGRKGMKPWERDLLYSAPMLGYAGAGLMSPVLTRASALDALEDLPAAQPIKPLPRTTVTQADLDAASAPQPIAPAGAAPALPETRGVTPGREIVVSPRIGPRMQLPPSSAPRPGGLTVDARALPGMIAREPRALLAERNVNELPAGDSMIAPGARLALPAPKNPMDAIEGEGRTPETGIRTVKGKIVPPEWAQPEAARESERVPAREHVGAPKESGLALREERARLAKLDKKWSELTGRLSRSKSYSGAKGATAKLRAIADERNALRQKFGLAPQTDEIADAANPTATYDSLTDEQREAVDAWVKEIPHLPQSLREETAEELKRYGDAYTPMKERVAKQMLEYEARKAAGEGGRE